MICPQEPESEAEPQPTEVIGELPGEPAPELEIPAEEPGEEDELDFEELDDFEFEEDEFIEINDWDAGSISQELLDQFNNPDSYEQIEFNGSADIELKNRGDIYYGDKITLVAKVNDTNLSYRLVWEAYDSPDRGWFTVGSGDQYSYTLTEENVDREYRVVLYTVD